MSILYGFILNFLLILLTSEGSTFSDDVFSVFFGGNDVLVTAI